MINECNEDFYNATTAQLLKHRPFFQELLQSSSLMDVFAGVKILHALIKHRIFFMIGDDLITCSEIIFRFPWSNIVHNAIVVIVGGIFLTEGRDEFILNLLESGLVRRIIEGLADPKPSGYKPHLRQIAASIRATPSARALEVLSADPLWNRFWELMEIRKNANLTFVQAEADVIKSLSESLGAPVQTPVADNSEAPDATPVPVPQAHEEAPKESQSPEEQKTEEAAAPQDAPVATPTEPAQEEAAPVPDSEKPLEDSAPVPTPSEPEQSVESEKVESPVEPKESS
jgi:hypothetical protein